MIDEEFFLPDEFIDALPEDAEQRFVLLEQRCRAQLNEVIASQQSGYSDLHLRRQYASLVSGYAEGLGIKGVAWQTMPETDEDAQRFVFDATRVVAKLKARRKPLASTVKLEKGTRGKLEQQIEILRGVIKSEVQPDTERDRLLRKLDELSMDLGSERVNLLNVVLTLGVICSSLVQTTSFLANVPQAITTIHRLLGEDKASEERARERLAAPMKPKALPSSPKRSIEAPKRIEAANWSRLSADDEIPF